MCDYSLHSVKSRPAKVDDKLTTRDFGTGTRGFAASENVSMAVCVLPGTELAFAHEAKRLPDKLWPWHDRVIKPQDDDFSANQQRQVCRSSRCA